MKTNPRNVLIRLFYWAILVGLIVFATVGEPIYWAQKGGFVLQRTQDVRNGGTANSKFVNVGGKEDSNDLSYAGEPVWSKPWASVNGLIARFVGEWFYKGSSALGLLALMGLFYFFYRKIEPRLFRPEQAILLLLFTTPLFGYLQLFNPLWLVVVGALGLLLIQKWVFSGCIIGGIVGGAIAGGAAALGGTIVMIFVIGFGVSGMFCAEKKKSGLVVAEILLAIGIAKGMFDLPWSKLVTGLGVRFNDLLLQFATAGTGVPAEVYWLLTIPILVAVIIGILGKDFKNLADVKLFVVLAAAFAWVQLVIWMYKNQVPELNMIVAQGLLMANPLFIGFWLNLRAFVRAGGMWQSWTVLVVLVIVATPVLCLIDHSLMFGSWHYIAILPMLTVLGWHGIANSFSPKAKLAVMVVLITLAMAIQIHYLRLTYALDVNTSLMKNEIAQAAKDVDMIVTDAFFVPELVHGLDKSIILVNSPADSAKYSRILGRNLNAKVLVISPINRDYGYLWKLGLLRADKTIEFVLAPSWGISMSVYTPDLK